MSGLFFNGLCDLWKAPKYRLPSSSFVHTREKSTTTSKPLQELTLRGASLCAMQQ